MKVVCSAVEAQEESKPMSRLLVVSVMVCPTLGVMPDAAMKKVSFWSSTSQEAR